MAFGRPRRWAGDDTASPDACAQLLLRHLPLTNYITLVHLLADTSRKLMVDHVVTSPSWQRGLPADCPMPTPFIWTACEVPLNGDIPEEHGTRQELGFALEDDDECLKFVQGELPEVIQMVRVFSLSHLFRT